MVVVMKQLLGSEMVFLGRNWAVAKDISGRGAPGSARQARGTRPL
jgi:hypothetical protein